MPELRSVTLSREQRDVLLIASAEIQVGNGRNPISEALDGMFRAWDAAEPLACHACNGTGLTPSLEGCGTRVQCRACHGTGRAS